MKPQDRDMDILRHIINYCKDIDDAINYFGDDYVIFSSNKTYRNACAMCILQIGELCNHLSPDFRESHPEMPWRQIRGMRNVVTHAYGSISTQTTWDTIKQDIPKLRGFCEECLE